MLSVKRRLRRPIRVTAFALSGALKDGAGLSGHKLTFVSGAGNKYDLTGDGATLLEESSIHDQLTQLSRT